MQTAVALKYPGSASQERLHTYPSRFSLLWHGGLLLGLAFSIVRWGEVALRAAMNAGAVTARLIDIIWPSLNAQLSTLPLPHFSWPVPAVGLTELLGAHMALFVALLAVYFLYDLFPTVSLAPDGIRVSSHGQWVFIPWGRIHRLVSTEPYIGDRLVVFVEVDTKRLGLKWRLPGILFGVGPRPGFLLTSDLRDFDHLVANMAQRLMEARGDQPMSEVIREDHFSTLFKLTLDLPAFLNQLLLPREREMPTPRQTLLLWAIMMSTWGALIILRAISSGDVHLSFIPLVILAALEAVVAATAFWALSDLYAGYPHWREISILYPFSQISRLWAFPWLAMAVAAAVPTPALILLGVGVALWSGYLGARFTQAYYSLSALRSAVPGALMPSLYFILLWEIFLFS